MRDRLAEKQKDKNTKKHTDTCRNTQKHTETHRNTQKHTETHRNTQKLTEMQTQIQGYPFFVFKAKSKQINIVSLIGEYKEIDLKRESKRQISRETERQIHRNTQCSNFFHV